MTLILLFKWVKKLIRGPICNGMKICWRNLTWISFLVKKSFVKNFFRIVHQPHPEPAWG